MAGGAPSRSTGRTAAGAGDGEIAISIIVPCRNEARFIAQCLGSIVSSDCGVEQLEILVADGRSEDGTREIIERFAQRHPQVKLVDNPRRTTPAALNAALRQARGAIIIRMDVHAAYPASYISELVAWLVKSKADNVGGRVETLPIRPTPKCRAIAAALSSPFGVGNSYFRIGATQPRYVDTVPFGCYRREVFGRIGYFDEDLIRNQDDEFNLRLVRSGGRVLLVPSIVSKYYARDALYKLWRMYYQYGLFKPLVCKKLGAVGTFRQMVPAAFVAILLASGLLAIYYHWMLGIFALIGAVYALCDLCISLRLAAGLGTRSLPWLLVVFPVLHFAYGLGYLAGMVRWFGRRRTRHPADLPISR